MPDSRKYTQRHYQDIAALLATERRIHGPSPALNRITAALTTMFADDSNQHGGRGSFDWELFSRAARGEVSVTAKPRRRERVPA